MTISSTTSRNDFIGAGSAGPFAFGYRIFAATDLQVIRRNAAGVETTLVYPIDFTISVGGVGNRNGGSITLASALAVGEALTVRRVLPLTQPTDLRNLGSYLPETLEDQFDRLVMIAQQHKDEIDRSFRLPVTVSPPTVSVVLPAPAPNNALVWSAAGTALENRTLDSGALVALPGDGRTVATLTAYLANNKVFNPLDFMTPAEVGDVTGNVGAVDVTAKVQACLTAAAGRRVVFPDGLYLVYGLKVPANTLVDLGGATLKKRPAIVTDQTVAAFTGDAVVFWTGGGGGYAPFFWLLGNRVTIRGGTLDGNRANDTLGTGVLWGGSFSACANRAGILGATASIASVTDVTIENVAFQNMVGVGINLCMTGTVRVSGCTENNNNNLFAQISGSDGIGTTTNGTLIFRDNIIANSPRAQNTVPNPFVLDRKDTIIFTGNVVDERSSTFGASSGSKFQDSNTVTITGNTFIESYVKAQSAGTFYGNSFTIAGNTFVSYTPSVFTTGVLFGGHRVKSLTVSANAITNGFIAVERSSDEVTIVGNTIRITTDARHGGAGTYFAILGGANQNGNVSGAQLIANNLIDLGGFAFHCFYQASFDYGNVDIIGNSVAGCDRLFSCMSTLDTSNMRVRILGNGFRKFRGIGRFNMSGIAELTFKGNTWSGIDTAAPSAIDGNSARESRWDANAGTYGRISVEGETFAAMEASWYFAQLSLGVQTLDTLAVLNNDFGGVYDTVSTGASFTQVGAGSTITNLWVKNNLAAGNLAFAGTHTNECIEKNDFLNAIRGVTGTTTGNRVTADQVLKFRTANSKTIPGTTSHSHRNAADSADNLLISDAGDVTARATMTATGYKVGANQVVTSRQAAIPDTAGATLAALETEVNKLKAMVRVHGLIS